MMDILGVSQAVGCQHARLWGPYDGYLRCFPGCRLPTYRAMRAIWWAYFVFPGLYFATIQFHEGHMIGILVVSQAVGPWEIYDRHFGRFPDCRLPTYRAINAIWLGILGVSEAVGPIGCQHTGQRGPYDANLGCFPGCRLPTYRARRAIWWAS